jgi:hypothetical protein
MNFSSRLLDLVLERAVNQVRDSIVILGLRGGAVLLGLLVGLLEALVALGQLAQGGQGVGAQLVQDAGDKLGQLLVLAVAVDGKGVGGDGGVDCGVGKKRKLVGLFCSARMYVAREPYR